MIPAIDNDASKELGDTLNAWTKAMQAAFDKAIPARVRAVAKTLAAVAGDTKDVNSLVIGYPGEVVFFDPSGKRLPIFPQWPIAPAWVSYVSEAIAVLNAIDSIEERGFT